MIAPMYSLGFDFWTAAKSAWWAAGMLFPLAFSN
jgi:hypothetical protein